MKVYEGLFILDPSLSADAITAVLAKVDGVVQKKNGSVVQRMDRGKMALGYKIDKRENGFVFNYIFNLEPASIQGVEYELRLIPEVIRFSIFKKNEKKQSAVAPAAAPATGSAQ